MVRDPIVDAAIKSMQVLRKAMPPACAIRSVTGDTEYESTIIQGLRRRSGKNKITDAIAQRRSIFPGIDANRIQQKAVMIIKIAWTIDCKGTTRQALPTSTPDIIRVCGCSDFRSPFPHPQNTKRSFIISPISCRCLGLIDGDLGIIISL